jgi:hypothetical protein
MTDKKKSEKEGEQPEQQVIDPVLLSGFGPLAPFGRAPADPTQPGGTTQASEESKATPEK